MKVKTILYSRSGQRIVVRSDTGGGVVIEDPGTGKITIKNAVTSLASIINELIDIIVGLKTLGSPANHVVSPDAIAKLTVLKTTWSSLAGE